MNLFIVQFSRSVMSDSLRPHELQHARPPCPSPTPGVHSDSRPSSLWCHPAISSSVVPFSSCPQSLPASESFPMSQLLTWGGQSTGVSASAASFQRHSRADLLQNGLVGSPCSPRDSQESSPTPQFKSINSLALSLLNIYHKLYIPLGFPDDSVVKNLPDNTRDTHLIPGSGRHPPEKEMATCSSPWCHKSQTCLSN